MNIKNEAELLNNTDYEKIESNILMIKMLNCSLNNKIIYENDEFKLYKVDGDSNAIYANFKFNNKFKTFEQCYNALNQYQILNLIYHINDNEYSSVNSSIKIRGNGKGKTKKEFILQFRYPIESNCSENIYKYIFSILKYVYTFKNQFDNYMLS